jgi:peptidoglycan/xylan/chitin deacetylase (PgdA/CDA1 family)
MDTDRPRNRIALALVYLALGSVAFSQASNGRGAGGAARQQPGTLLSLDQLKAQMFHVSAGRRLKPPTWPNGARVAVSLSFDVDNASIPLLNGDLSSESLSRGEYGAVDGLPRILAVLARQDIPASFYVPAVSAALHPSVIDGIRSAKQRHEIGIHGWIHEDLPRINDEAKEQDLLNKAIEYLTQVTGKRPVGYRAPAWHFSQFTMKQVKEAGFLYDSSLMASDDAYEILLDGKPTGVIELPIERISDDAPYFGAATGSLPSPDLVESIFRAEFDMAYDEGGLFLLTMHPHWTGHRSRAVGLEKLIVHIKSKPGVWFATEEQIANYIKSTAWKGK